MIISNKTKITLLLMSLMTMMANVVITTDIPHFKDIFNDENIELLSRLMLTLPSVVIAFLAPVLGQIIYKIGKKKSALIGLVWFSLTGTAGFWLGGLYSILFSRALLGLGIATLMIVTTSLVGDYFEGEERNKYMGLQSAFNAIGGVFFVVGGGILSDIDWRYPFLIYGAGILLLPLATLFIREVRVKETSHVNVSIVSNLHIYLLGFLIMVIFFIMPTQMPFLIINHFGASGKLAGMIISTAFFSNAIGALFYSKIKRHFEYATVYIIGLIIIGIGFSGIGLLPNVYWCFITSPIMGFGGGLMMTNIIVWLLSTTTFSTRVKSSSYLTSAFFLGQFCSPLITMPFVSYFGVQHFFTIMGVIVFIISFMMFLWIKSYNNFIKSR